MQTIKQILMHRDGMTAAEAQELIDEARAAVEAGADPEEILYEYFELEPDYIYELL